MIQQLAGIAIFVSFILTLYAYFIDSELFIYSGVLVWIALVMLYRSITKKLMLNILILISFSFFLYSMSKGFDINTHRALLVNQHLLILLVGVGFLRLIATPKQNKIKTLPKGKSSFLKTYLGIHLFGSVINLSALILVADKLYKKASISKLQLILMTRAFSSDAYWSPFFVAFAAALTYAPNLSASYIFINGLFLALMAFVFTYFEVMNKERFNMSKFRGYPIHFETLYIPLLLALMVLLIHHYFPELKVIVLIALFSVLLTVLLLPMKVGLKKAIRQFNHHIIEELPQMKNELGLFLVAGAFGVAISSILIGFDISSPFSHFDGLSASILLLVFILLSFVGIHPIISIAIVGNWMTELNHTLLAITFLLSWATAVSTSPFSGLNLTIQSRYDIKAIEIFKANISYALKMYILGVCTLFLAEYLLNL